MISRMSKVEIVGPKKLLLEVLTLVRKLGVFHIEPEPGGFVEEVREAKVTALFPDEKIISERLMLEELGRKIDVLVSCLPKTAIREIYLRPPEIFGSIAAVVGKHLAYCGELKRRKERLREELAELERHTVFIEALESLFRDMTIPTDLEFVGVTLKEPQAVEQVRRLLLKLTDGQFEIFTTVARDSSLVVLLAVEKGVAGKVRDLLSGERIPELVFPESIAHMTLPGKIGYVRDRMKQISAEVASVEAEMEKFGRHWLAIYLRVREWVWVQEEPQNMGAWTFIEPRLRALDLVVDYVGRDASASPATVPGTPTARYPCSEAFSMRLPFASRYIFRFAVSGATSR